MRAFRSRTSRLVVAALIVTGLTGTAFGEASRSYHRNHPLHSLDSRVAETLAWEICGRIGSTERDPCKVTESTEGKLFVLGPDEAHSAIVKMLAERDPTIRSAERFEVMLLRTVEPPNGNAPSHFPEHVADALRGVQELLPDLRFDAIATGWVRTSDRGQIRLVDEDGDQYRIEIHYRERRLGLDRTELIVGVTAERDINNPNLRDMLSTTLSVYVGETVVVGSSTPRGSEAPVVFLLLTAG